MADLGSKVVSVVFATHDSGPRACTTSVLEQGDSAMELPTSDLAIGVVGSTEFESLRSVDHMLAPEVQTPAASIPLGTPAGEFLQGDLKYSMRWCPPKAGGDLGGVSSDETEKKLVATVEGVGGDGGDVILPERMIWNSGVAALLFRENRRLFFKRMLPRKPGDFPSDPDLSPDEEIDPVDIDVNPESSPVWGSSSCILSGFSSPFRAFRSPTSSRLWSVQMTSNILNSERWGIAISGMGVESEAQDGALARLRLMRTNRRTNPSLPARTSIYWIDIVIRGRRCMSSCNARLR